MRRQNDTTIGIAVAWARYDREQTTTFTEGDDPCVVIETVLPQRWKYQTIYVDRGEVSS